MHEPVGKDTGYTGDSIHVSSGEALVIDHFLQQIEFRALWHAVTRFSFPWVSGPILVGADGAPPAPSNLQDAHIFFSQDSRGRYVSPYMHLLFPLLRRLNPHAILRIKLNKTSRQLCHIQHGFHVDARFNGLTTLIFYLNTNNGYTLFEDDRRVQSEANRLLVFDAARQHTGVSCTDEEYRYVLNMNLWLAHPVSSPSLQN